MAGTTVTNTGPSLISGDVGVSPGTAVAGFPPGVVTGGAIHAGDPLAASAQASAVTAYNALAGEAPTQDLTGMDLGGMTLAPGVYHFAAGAALTGTLLLDATGNPTGTLGNTTITSGATLSVDADSELGGNPAGTITFRNGELLTTGASFQSARTISLRNETDILAAATGTTATYTGNITGNGVILTVGDFVNGGTVVLSGVNTYNGGTDVQGTVPQGSDIPNGGTLIAASDQALGTGPVDMFRGILIIQQGVTIANPIEFIEGGIVDNQGTLNNSITDAFNVAQVVINWGTSMGMCY